MESVQKVSKVAPVDNMRFVHSLLCTMFFGSRSTVDVFYDNHSGTTGSNSNEYMRPLTGTSEYQRILKQISGEDVSSNDRNAQSANFESRMVEMELALNDTMHRIRGYCLHPTILDAAKDDDKTSVASANNAKYGASRSHGRAGSYQPTCTLDVIACNATGIPLHAKLRKRDRTFAKNSTDMMTDICLSSPKPGYILSNDRGYTSSLIKDRAAQLRMTTISTAKATDHYFGSRNTAERHDADHIEWEGLVL